MNWTDRLQGLLTEKASRRERVRKNIERSERAAASQASVADRKRTETGYYQTQTRGNSDDMDNMDSTKKAPIPNPEQVTIPRRSDKASFVPGSADEGGNRDFRGPKRQTAGGRKTGTKIPASQRTPAATAGRVSARRAASQARKPSQFSAGDPGAKVVGAVRGALSRLRGGK